MSEKQMLRALLVSCACALTLYAGPPSLTILHTNDMHASFVPHEAVWVKSTPKPLIGGFLRLSLAVDSIRSRNSAILLLDAGDVMTGNPIADLEYKGAQGGALMAMMNQIGYDAWSPGNHDFDISQENLTRLTQIARFPTISANLVRDNGAFAINNRPYITFKRGRVTVGVIGVMSQELYSLVNQNNLTGIRVLSPAVTTQKYVDKLRKKTDVLIALTHQGFSDDSVLATQVEGLDIIIGGHSHTRLSAPRTVNGVVIAQAGANCENLGVLELTVKNRRVQSCTGRLLPLWYRREPPKTRLSTFIDSIQTVIQREYSQVVATLTQDWVRSRGESDIGRFVADAQRQAAGAEVGFMNTHGIRRDLAAGPVTKRDVFELLPFRNLVTTFQLSGSQLHRAMLHHLKEQTAVQFAGIACRWKKTTDGDVEIIQLQINDEALAEEKMYRCAASDFFIGEAKRYLGIEISPVITLKVTVFEAIERALRDRGEITPSDERFIVEVP